MQRSNRGRDVAEDLAIHQYLSDYKDAGRSCYALFSRDA